MKYLRSLFLLLCLNLFGNQSNSNDSLIVLPDVRWEGIHSSDPFISLIDRAKNEILMASYKLQEKKLPQQDLLDALKRANDRGVTVHLISENRLSEVEVVEGSGGVEKGDSRRAYEERGVKIYSNLGKFSQSHTKFIIVDGKEVMIGNTNFDKDPEGVRSLQPPSRDFSVLTKDPLVIEELTVAFWADARGEQFSRCSETLLWGPEGQREKIYALLESAKHSIRIYQQDVTDEGVMERLVQAAKRGVEVELIMSPHTFGWNNPDNNTPNQDKLMKAGGHVFLTSSVSVHAKVFILDDELMYLGSTNFYQPAIDQNRNVGLMTRNSNLISQVLQVFAGDKNAR